MYTGGKNECGAYQTIINQIPPHKTYMGFFWAKNPYIELFLGSGAVIRRKRPAKNNIGVEINQNVIDMFDYTREDIKVFCEDALDFLKRHKLVSSIDTFIYMDPTYLIETRKCANVLYDNELSDLEHLKLLKFARSSRSMIMISGYESNLYNKHLASWRKVHYNLVDRSREVREECLWMNYDFPDQLHDYQFLGKDATDRQRIKRKIESMLNKFSALPSTGPYNGMFLLCQLKSKKSQ